MLCIMLLPFSYGMLQVGLLGAFYGAGVSSLGFTALWLYFAYADMSKRREMTEILYHTAEDAKSQIELEYKVQKGCVEAARANAEEVRQDLIASREIADDLMKQVGELHKEVQAASTKDALVEALQRRVSNINAEYHSKHYDRRGTTLADVYKLTGEADV